MSVEYDKIAASICLEEYKSCRTEIQQSLAFIQDFHKFELIVLGSIIAFIATHVFSNHDSLKYPTLYTLVYLLPLFCYILALASKPHHYRIVLNAKYIKDVLAQNIYKHARGEGLLGWEQYIHGCRESTLKRFNHLMNLEYTTHIIAPTMLLFILVIIMLNDINLPGHARPITPGCITWSALAVIVLIAINIIACILVIIDKCHTKKLYASIGDANKGPNVTS